MKSASILSGKLLAAATGYQAIVDAVEVRRESARGRDRDERAANASALPPPKRWRVGEGGQASAGGLDPHPIASRSTSPLQGRFGERRGEAA